MEDNSNEHLEASVVLAGLFAVANKHQRDDSPDAAGGSVKKFRHDETSVTAAAAAQQQPTNIDPRELKPYPFFYYTDHSGEEDPDSLTPLTPPGRVPNFPAKMHAIMSRPDLADVICWMDHGRSWKVLKPREFEVRVIPTYFEHAKFSSFIRQANGWGFRRITTGRDRNSYYHPMFLQSLPHLCKMMKRPGVAKKLAADPDHEPDLYKISELHPLPKKTVDDAILLQCTLQGGPKARMPIYSGILGAANAPFVPDINLQPAESKKIISASITAPAPPKLSPADKETLVAFDASVGAFSAKTSPLSSPASSADEASKPSAATAATTKVAAPPQQPSMPMPFMMPPFMMPPGMSAFAPQAFPTTPNPVVPQGSNPTLSALACANQMAFGNANPFAALQQANAASQFAAGFAAAAAFNQQQMQTMLQTMQAQSKDPKP